MCASSSLAPRQLVSFMGRSSGGAFGAHCPNDLPRGNQQASNCARNIESRFRTPIHCNYYVACFDHRCGWGGVKEGGVITLPLSGLVSPPPSFQNLAPPPPPSGPMTRTYGFNLLIVLRWVWVQQGRKHGPFFSY